MAVGSAFDAYVKAFLEKCLFGNDLFEALFEQQVSPHVRDWALVAGKYAFEAYRTSGALIELLVELQEAKDEPVFEGTVQALVDGVPFLGKPDVFFVNKMGAHVIFDWKVNGYCSNSGVSPKRGYITVRDGWSEGKNSRNNKQAHKDAQPLMVDGIMINAAQFFEEIDSGWANQLCIYAWTLGERIGSKFVIGIDQLACRPGGAEGPKIRVASHRGRASEEYQMYLIQLAKEAWRIITSGHIFDDTTLENSNTRCRTLDTFYKSFQDPDFSKIL
jgi:hypothetical protein